MVKSILVSMDVEPDLTKYINNSFLGIEIIPKFLSLLENLEINCDFFITVNAAEKLSSDVIANLVRNHFIGCHGTDHTVDYYCRNDFKWQFNELKKATDRLESLMGTKMQMFRAPNFSADGDTVKVLEKLGYILDSSILPGRVVRKWKLFTIYDYRNAPLVSYNPSYGDITKKGRSTLVEIPLTENPEMPGAPVGVGYLNLFGVEKTMDVIRKCNQDYVTFLIHPWELIDLGKHFPEIPDGWKAGCKENWDELSLFLHRLKDEFNVCNLIDIYNESIP